MKQIFFAVVIITLASCATTKNTPVSLNKTVSFSIPETGTVITAPIGTTLVKKGVLVQGPGFRLNTGLLIDRTNNSLYPCSKANSTVQQHWLSYKKSNGDMCASGFIIDSICSSGTEKLVEDICFTEEGNKYYLDYVAFADFPFDSSKVSKVQVSKTFEGDFTQEFIYNGKVDNNIKFIYREFYGGTARPAFTQEVQYDAQDSKQIAFKNMVLEIIEANNQSITFKLISNF